VLKLVFEAKRSWTGISMDNLSFFRFSLPLVGFFPSYSVESPRVVQHRVHSSLKFCIVRTVSALTFWYQALSQGLFTITFA
jgi:hypothetical protein